jgi:PAS domain S-box-containing protein
MKGRSEIILYSIAFLIILISSLYFFVQNHNQDMSEEIIQRFAEEELLSTQNIAKVFESEINDIQNRLNLIAMNKEVIQGDTEICNKKLKESLNNFNGRLGNIGRVNKEGIFYCGAVESIIGINGLQYDYLKTLFEDPNHNPVLSRGVNFEYEDGTQEELLALHIPIYDEEGNFDGTLGAAIYLDEVGKNFLSEVEILGEGYIILIDDNGDVLYHPNQEEITNFLTNASSDRDPKLTELVLDGIKGNSGIKNYFFNEEKIATYYPAKIWKNRTWMVFTNFPVEATKGTLISSSLKGMLTKMLFYYSIIIILVFLILIFLMEKRIFKPITDLTNSVDKITQGKLNIELPKSNTQEVQKLTNALNRILASLKLAILKTGSSKTSLGIGSAEAIKAKEDAEERLNLALKGTKDGIWDWDLKTNKVHYSDKWKSMVGYNPEEIKNEFSEWEKLLHPEDKTRALNYAKEHIKLKGKTPFEIEFKMKHKKGHYVPILARAFLQKDSTGKPIRMVGTHINLTERKKYEERIKRSENLHKSILNGIKSGVWVSDKSDTITYANKGMGLIAGIKPEQIIGKNILKDFSKETIENFNPHYLQAKKTLKSIKYESIPVKTPSGKQGYQSGWIIPRVRNKKYNGMIVTVEAVSRKKTI